MDSLITGVLVIIAAIAGYLMGARKHDPTVVQDLKDETVKVLNTPIFKVPEKQTDPEVGIVKRMSPEERSKSEQSRVARETEAEVAKAFQGILHE